VPAPARPGAEVRRLHFINALFAQATGHDLYLAEQIRSAIAFSLAELEARIAASPEQAARYDEAFNAAAAELLARLFARHPRHGFYHWDASLTLAGGTPLFNRAEIMAGLRRLAGYREATLLVTNLRSALIPPGRRATARRRAEYAEALAFIRDLAAARTARGTELHLLFL
jgi:hypothetical protein